MTQNMTFRVLSTLSSRGVTHLLMGGQACILYGGAEFSRDTDIAVLADPDNLSRLQAAVGDLDAECIAVPPFSAEYLHRGHAIHFRCRRPDVNGMRLDVMSVMRDVDGFSSLWRRRTTVAHADMEISLLSLSDLVAAKKTQRDKDWLMIRNLVDASFFQNRDNPTREHLLFWLRELRTPEHLMEIAEQHPQETRTVAADRSLLNFLASKEMPALRQRLHEEEEREREADRMYWQPLKSELEAIRRGRPSQE